MPPTRQLIRSPRASERLRAARTWLESIPAGREALVIESGWEAADDLVREFASERRALFAIHRLTLNRMVGLMAAEDLARAQLVPAGGLAAEAIVARAVYRLKAAGAIPYFEPIADRPGFPTAMARTLEELRLSGITRERLEAAGAIGQLLGAILTQFEVELADAALIDRAGMFAIAIAAASRSPAPRFVGIPVLLLDLPVTSRCERDFIAALAHRAPSILATVPSGDYRTEAYLESALGVTAERFAPDTSNDGGDSLARLQDHLFENSTPPLRELDRETVSFLSAPGENRECVELARRIQAEARRGVPFDRIVILLHAPGQYTSHLEEALRRADIPAYFARGTARPEPGGRALLTLLACAAENLSARRFAEYISLAQVPDEVQAALPSNGTEAGAMRFIPADVEMIPAALSSDFEPPPASTESHTPSADPVPVVEGTLRAPWRWEQLLVDAAVIGSRERWKRRLDGLEGEFRTKRDALDDDEPRAAFFDRQLVDLAHLKEVALKQIGALDALPKRALWGEWLGHLRALVHLAIRDRDPVLAALAELEPMAPVGPIDLDEVRLVLANRLGKLTVRPNRRRYGAVFVGVPMMARGLAFDVVMVPGLAERIFPKKLTEDPILPDEVRGRLSPDLITQSDRVAAERMALRLAVGAARRKVILSYPRIDLDQGRPRVPSFYALEILRAAEGRLPGFEELARRAGAEAVLRLGWPAPAIAEHAIDDAEFDLALLEGLVGADPESTAGSAHYLLSANDHLARALRARARRWLRRWTPADGLVDLEPAALAALARHRFSARSYSPTALQQFAACPYRFLLYAVHRLEPREEPEAIEAIDPLTRGALFHEVQFELLTALKGAGALPITADNLAGALEQAGKILDEVAGRYRDELAPAIERVWDDGIAAIRADLREWLRRASENPDGWCPERFELSFGLTERTQADPASSHDPIAVAGGLRLRGSIDLIERHPRGVLRVTDHKTGKVVADKAVVVGGGRILQPLLYALAAEKLLDVPVESGRLYYCTSVGAYEERTVNLDTAGRATIEEVIKIVGGALDEGFLPAMPRARECRYCDYRPVCGPYEELRAGLKPKPRLANLMRLREMP
jgi:ATP-dependent helicase/nuclease subunit B